MEKEYYIKKWLEGSLSEEERKDFEATEDYRSLERLSKNISAFKAPDFDAEEELKQLNARKSKGGKVVAMNWVRPLLKIAAVFLLMFGAGYFYISINDTSNFQETISLVKEPFYLPDSSQVILNANSELKYSSNNWENKRLAELNGEGFFKVAKGSKFEILTESGTVTVLGTEFNVKMRQNYFEVICYEGAVEVKSPRRKVILKPFQTFRIVNGVTSEGRVSLNSSPSWVEGESTFESVPLLHVIEEFERQYEITVDWGDLDTTQLFSGRFTHSEIYLALRSIAVPLNFEYQIDGNQVIFRSGHKE